MSDKETYTDMLVYNLAKCTNRNQAAWKYALMLDMPGPDGLDWETVNDIIRERWSLSGLVYIKALAWKMREKEIADG